MLVMLFSDPRPRPKSVALRRDLRGFTGCLRGTGLIELLEGSAGSARWGGGLRGMVPSSVKSRNEDRG